MDWIVGDLHGMLNTLMRLVDRVASQDPSPRFIFVGDYADRGPSSRELVDYLLEFPYPAVFLRGNHDDVLDYLLNGTCCSELIEFIVGRVTPGNVCRWWLDNGFVPTLQSYGVIDASDPMRPYALADCTPLVEAFRNAAPETHKRFFNNLAIFWESDTHFACHGFFDPRVHLPRNFSFVAPRQYLDVLWTRFPGNRTRGIELAMPVWDKTGVFGHTPVEFYGSTDAIRFPRIRLIDTGVWLGRHLTAYCCQTDTFVGQPAAGEDTAVTP